MESLILVLVGILVAVATYLILSKQLLRVILGTAVLSHAAHLLILTMGGLKKGAVPLLGESEGPYTDALPQALILTAIVISFAVTAFVLVLGYRAYKTNGSGNFDELRGTPMSNIIVLPLIVLNYSYFTGFFKRACDVTTYHQLIDIKLYCYY